MSKKTTSIALAMALLPILGIPQALADTPQGHDPANPWQPPASYGAPMDPQQMEAMRQQRMRMMQQGQGMPGGPQGDMDPRMMQNMQMMRQQRMQMMQGGGPGMQRGPGSQHQSGMMPPMMQNMMKKRDQHWQQVEQRLANIEALLQQLVDLQKK